MFLIIIIYQIHLSIRWLLLHEVLLLNIFVILSVCVGTMPWWQVMGLSHEHQTFPLRMPYLNRRRSGHVFLVESASCGEGCRQLEDTWLVSSHFIDLTPPWLRAPQTYSKLNCKGSCYRRLLAEVHLFLSLHSRMSRNAHSLAWSRCPIPFSLTMGRGTSLNHYRTKAC